MADLICPQVTIDIMTQEGVLNKAFSYEEIFLGGRSDYRHLSRDLEIRDQLIEYSSFNNHYQYRTQLATLSIFYVVKGKASFSIDNGKTCLCYSNSFLIVNKGSSIEFSTQNNHDFDLKVFCFEKFDSNADILRIGKPQLAHFCLLGIALNSAIRDLKEEKSTCWNQFIIADQSLLEHLSDHLKQEMELSSRLPTTNPETRLFLYEKVCHARDHIFKNLTNSISLDDLASEVAMSKYHFNRCFSSVFLVSPYQFIIEMRLQIAMHLISANRIQLSEIPNYLQFTDFAYFSNQFKQRFGIRPSVLMRNHISNRQHLPVDVNVN